MASERIAKAIAATGACSRRDAEKIIAEGRVELNGIIVSTPATLVQENDILSIDNEELKRAKTTRLWCYYKPIGLLTTHRDPEGRPTIFENLPRHLPRVISVGRLDMNSEGLLLLTNSGTLARALEHPSAGHARTYRVRTDGVIAPEFLAEFARGVTVEGVHYKPISVTEEPGTEGRNRWYQFTLHEGKNREIRRLCEYAGVQVSRLIRVAYGPYVLGDLKAGAVREV